MNRRNFFRVAGAGAAGLTLPSVGLAQASASSLASSSLAGGVFYTKGNAGRWSNKVGGHLPRIETDTLSDGRLQVTVSNGHEMRGFEHYIVKHVLLDHDMNFIGETRFDPRRDLTPESHFVLESYRGPLFALSVCNRHDTWLNTIEI